MKINNSSRTDVGLIRKANEDSMGMAETPIGNLFVVCDGMGGHLGGAAASKIGVECIIEYVNNKNEDNVGDALLNAVKFANTQIFAKAIYDPSLTGMGSTCVVLLITPDGLAWTCHVGDSRIYLFREESFTKLTKDHSYVQFLVDTGQIKEEDAESHPNKNQILKALGSEENVVPELCTSPYKLQNGDMFLLCSDGLSGMVNDNDIKTIIEQNTLNEIPEKLVGLALANGGRDNVTVVLAEVIDIPRNLTEISEASITKRVNDRIVPKRKKNRLIIVAALLIALVSVAFFFHFNKKGDLQIKTREENKDSIKVSADTASTKRNDAKVKGAKDNKEKGNKNKGYNKADEKGKADSKQPELIDKGEKEKTIDTIISPKDTTK